MAIQLSVAVRNAMLDIIETTAGTAAILEIRTGTQPSDCAAADSGTLLASMTLDSNWMNDASSGTKTLTGTWSDSSANATNTAGHFRLKNSGGSTCHMQGSVTITGGGGDMTLDNTSIASGQAVTITSFTLTAPNA